MAPTEPYTILANQHFGSGAWKRGFSFDWLWTSNINNLLPVLWTLSFKALLKSIQCGKLYTLLYMIFFFFILSHLFYIKERTGNLENKTL